MNASNPSFSKPIRRGFIATMLAAAAVFGGITASHAQDTIRLRLDWLPTGYHAPIFFAAKQGFYRDEGINLVIEDGKGTNASLQAIAAGNNEIAIANYSTMIQASATGMDVIGIGGMVQRLPDAIVSLESNPVKAPADLVGKTIATSPGSAASKLLVAFFNSTGIDPSKVTVVNTASGQAPTAVLSGTAQAMTGWSFTDALLLNKQKTIAKPILMSDHGINILGNGFVTTKAYAAKNGDVLRRFMKATAKGYELGFKDPKASIAAMMAERPVLSDAALMEQQLVAFPPFLHSKRSEGMPFGFTVREDWDQTEKLLREYFELTAKVDVGSLYTNDYIAKK